MHRDELLPISHDESGTLAGARRKYRRRSIESSSQFGDNFFYDFVVIESPSLGSDFFVTERFVDSFRLGEYLVETGEGYGRDEVHVSLVGHGEDLKWRVIWGDGGGTGSSELSYTLSWLGRVGEYDR